MKKALLSLAVLLVALLTASIAWPPGSAAQMATVNAFPFGYFGVEEPVVQNPGFSPRVYIDSTMRLEAIPEVMSLAASGGIQVYQYIPAGVLSLPLTELRDKWIEPAVSYGPEVMAGFYPSEEPGTAEIGKMKDLLNLVHESDPLGRPVVTYLGYYDPEDIRPFLDTVDVNLMGAYPVYKGYPQAVMTGIADSGRQAMWPVGKEFYAAPETFGPILSHPQGPLLVRNNIYQAVIGGAAGIICYEGSGFDAARYPAFHAEMVKLRDEFVGSGNLGAVVLSPDPPQVVTHRIVSGPTNKISLDEFENVRSYDRIQYHLEVYQGHVYLLAANIAADALTVEFSGLPSAAANVEVLFEGGRTVPLAGGIFSDSFGPYAVHVYRATATLPAGFALAVNAPKRGLVTNQPQLTVSGSVTPISAVTVNGASVAVASSGFFNHTMTLSEGTQEIRVQSASALITRMVTLDTVPPNTSITRSAASGVPPFTFEWQGSDTGSGVTFYSYRLDGGEWSLWTCSTEKSYGDEEVAALGLSTGTHTFQVRARDRAGNIDPTPAQVTFNVIANTAPSNPAASGAASGVVGVPLTLTFTATDPDGDAISYRIFWDDGTNSGWGPLVPSGTPYQATHTWNEGGRYFVRVQVRDARGTTTPWSKTAFQEVNITGPITRKMPFGYYVMEEPVRNPQFTPRVYIDSTMRPEAIPQVFAVARAGGVQVYQYIPAGVLGLSLSTLRDQWVRPAVAFGPEVMAGFYPSEEPGYSEIPKMRDLLNLVHEEDPLSRPVVTYLGMYDVSEIRPFLETIDIDLIGAYPIYKGYPQALMTGLMDTGRQVLWPAGKRFYAVPETFGPILTNSQGPLRLRNNIYQALIGGADGIICYEVSGFDPTRYPAFYAELLRLNQEIVGSGNLGAVVLSPDPPQVVTARITSGPTTKIMMDMFEYTRYYDRIQFKLEQYEGYYYLLAANVAAEAITVQFSGMPSSATSVTVLFENDRMISMSGGSFSDTFSAYAVHIYRAPVGSAPWPTPTNTMPVVNTPTRTPIAPTPTWTRYVPTATATRVAATATRTPIAPTPTWTRYMPTATATRTSVAPTPTWTRYVPTATATRTLKPTLTPTWTPVTGEGVRSITIPVAASADDADSNGYSGVQYSRWYVNLPSWSHGFWRFQLPLPQGSTIVSAYLRFRADTYWRGSAIANLKLIDVANCANFVNDPYNQPTWGNVVWDTPSKTPGNYWHVSADISPLVQHFVEMPDYAPGNYIGLTWHPALNAADRSVWSKDGGYGAQLVINYLEGSAALAPAPTDTPTPVAAVPLPTATPTVPPSAATGSALLKIAASADDADSNAEGGVNIAKWSINLPYWSRGFWRFRVDIPAGSRIYNAYLKFRTDTYWRGAHTAHFKLLDEANCAPFTSDPYNRPTWGDVIWKTPVRAAGNFWLASSNVGELVQHFVDRPDYAPGNYMGVAWYPAEGAADRSVWSFDGGFGAQLVITYGN